ncbi:MAG: hypothetical protein RSB51_03315, partial [Clostridia bacterium]
MSNKKKIIVITIIVVLTLILAIGGIVAFKYYKDQKNALAAAKLFEYQKLTYQSKDFIYEEENGNNILAKVNEDLSISLVQFDKDFNKTNESKSKIKLAKELQVPIYIDKLKDGYFILFNGDAKNGEKNKMYALKADNSLNVAWKKEIELQGPQEELLSVIKKDEVYTFYMAFINGTVARNNVIRIDASGNLIYNKFLDKVTTGSLIDMFEKDKKLELVIKSNLGLDDEIKVTLGEFGNLESSALSTYIKPTDYEKSLNLEDSKLEYGSKEKSAYIRKIDLDGKELWKNVIERKDTTRIGKIETMYKLSNGNYMAIYLEGVEKKDFRKDKINDLYNVNEILIYSKEGKLIKTIDIIKELGIKYAPMKFSVDNQDNFYVYGGTAQYISAIGILDQNGAVIKKESLSETTVPKHIAFTQEGNVYYSVLDIKTNISKIMKLKWTRPAPI